MAERKRKREVKESTGKKVFAESGLDSETGKVFLLSGEVAKFVLRLSALLFSIDSMSKQQKTSAR